MKVTIVGTGYVGLVSGACFAETGNDVICNDIDKEKIKNLKKGKIPIYEPGLEEIVKRNIKENRLKFSTNIKDGVKHAEILISAVGTPPDKDHRADLRFVKEVAKSFGENVEKYTVFVNKSTVPVGTGEIVKKIISEEVKKRNKKIDFSVVSNPEFLREGAAIKDTLNPDRIVVGTREEKAKKLMQKLYTPFTRAESPIIFTSIKSAEIIKYAANSFLATKISFINEISNLCELAGGDITEIAKGIGMDKRIGSRFLHSGIGYGGSCFPKDVSAIIQTARDYGLEMKILNAVQTVNEKQKEKIFEILRRHFKNDLEDKKITVLGLAFKPKTDDMRDAASIKIIKMLQAEGAKIKAFDPVATENAKKIFSKVNIEYMSNPYEAIKDTQAILIVTEWDEFRNIDLKKVKKLMKGNTIIDGRNIFDKTELKELGFQYYSIGR